MGMDAENEKRNSADGTDQVDGGVGGLQQGVGGRQANPLPPAGGGGYQDTCGFFKFRPAADQKKRDPRLDELTSMGLPRTWLQVAEAIGVDAFLAMWRILDADDSLHEDNMIKSHLRPYRSYLRFQRNRYIETLAALKVPCATIRDMLKRQLGEEISERHISNLANKK
jgi:hypothetical protein